MDRLKNMCIFPMEKLSLTDCKYNSAINNAFELSGNVGLLSSFKCHVKFVYEMQQP